MQLIERYRGSLLGLAVGDALGAPVEFKVPGSFPPVNDMTGGGAFDVLPGQWTDDTSMALCLAQSLIEQQGFNGVDQLQKYVRWWREGYLSSIDECFDIGNATLAALIKFEETHEPYCGSTDPKSAGNGSLMRLASVPLFYAKNPREAIVRSAQSSRTTHQATAAIDACRYFGALLVGAVNGASREELLSEYYCPIPGYWDENPLVAEIQEIAAGSFKRRQPPEIQGSGYVVQSLEAALWAFYHSQTFREGCLLAVNLGMDADTTGAVYGQFAGAFYGESGIPQSWRSQLIRVSLIESIADQLYAAQ